MSDLPVFFWGGKLVHAFSPAHLLRRLRGGGLEGAGGRAQVCRGHPKVALGEDTQEGPEERAGRGGVGMELHFLYRFYTASYA